MVLTPALMMLTPALMVLTPALTDDHFFSALKS
jgi:hypothetical protein